jgi:hypothetical protein
MELQTQPQQISIKKSAEQPQDVLYYEVVMNVLGLDLSQPGLHRAMSEPILERKEEDLVKTTEEQAKSYPPPPAPPGPMPADFKLKHLPAAPGPMPIETEEEKKEIPVSTCNADSTKSTVSKREGKLKQFVPPSPDQEGEISSTK